MISLLALRNLAHRPWRSALLFFGFGIGVGVMIVLLSIGEALLVQARDEKLVGGGQVTVLPEGLDIEVMKTGGLGGMFFSIDRARFIYLQLLASPRHAVLISAVAPQIEGKLLYLRHRGVERAVRATGELPSATRAVGAAPALAAGEWVGDEGDRRWATPTLAELRHDIDHFHLPPDSARDRESWGEWHYFNVLSTDRRRWAFISLIVGGDVPRGQWGGQVAITLREQGRGERRFSATASPPTVRFSTTAADLRIGSSSVTVLEDGRYAVRAVGADATGVPVRVDLIVTPAPRAYFPGATLGGSDFVSGYTVPALRASATGTICVRERCERYADAQAYHDHNWGLWRGVTWEWGAARAGAFTVLYGRVHSPDTREAEAPLFLYLVDSLGFRALFRPTRITYEDARVIVVDGHTVRVPARAAMADVRGDDTLHLSLEIEDAIGTDTRRSAIERGDPTSARAIATPYFIQMKGLARLNGQIGGVEIRGVGTGFFETYR
jgi:hypothetical protein